VDMTIGTTDGILKKFRRNPSRFQRTFATPLPQLDKFVAAILSVEDQFEEATLIIDEVVFEPKTINGLLQKHAISTTCRNESSFVAIGMAEIHELLQAALKDWVDFFFITKPKAVIIYADHDEYTTFFANTKGNLSRMADELLSKGFKEVLGYQRTF
jgi:hypothetical protein